MGESAQGTTAVQMMPNQSPTGIQCHLLPDGAEEENEKMFNRILRPDCSLSPMIWEILNAFAVNMPAMEKLGASRGPMTWLPPSQSQVQSSGQSKTHQRKYPHTKTPSKKFQDTLPESNSETTPCSRLTRKDNSKSRPSKKEP